SDAAAGNEQPAVEFPDDDDYPPFTMPYQRGEGYFKLFMFREAAQEFEAVISSQPEHLHARLYLALCCIQLDGIAEAYRHLQVLLHLSEDTKLQAVAYNALGCVQAILGNMDQACESFHKSHALDPNFEDPVYNLKACQTNGGVLQLGVAMS
ncbi:tetratricopeptide repeat protein, partial [Cutibacterium acnes]